MEKLLCAEMLKEEPLTPTSKALPNKSVGMYIKSYNYKEYQIQFDPQQEKYTLFNLIKDPSRENNLWNFDTYADIRAEMVKQLLFGRMALELLWMPRIAGA